MSALASPETFVWSRLTDAALSVANQAALETHARVERWALDEVPLPGKFVHQLIEWLYREDRFCRGELKIDEVIGPQCVSAPTLAIVNTADDVAPLEAVKPFIESLATRDARIIEPRNGSCKPIKWYNLLNSLVFPTKISNAEQLTTVQQFQ